jgi:hypothetical protein
MKRDHEVKYEYGVFSHCGLTWQQCCKCKKDFRWEKGFSFLAGPFHGGIGKWYYLCSNCAPNLKTANYLAVNKCYIPERPPAPPPPPPKKK